MKLRLLVPCFALALLNLTARAQDNPSQVNPSTSSQIGVGSTDVGLYVNPVGIHITNSQADTGPFAFLGANTTARTFYGANIGGYINFYHAPRFDAGIDIRDSIVSANNAHLNSFLVGGRVIAKPIAEKFKPYLQLSVGVGSSKPPTKVRSFWMRLASCRYLFSRSCCVSFRNTLSREWEEHHPSMPMFG